MVRSLRFNQLRALEGLKPEGTRIGWAWAMTNPDDIHGDPRTCAILGAAMEVQGILHRGFLESIYCHALRIEFTARSIPFETEVPCAAEYKGQRLGGLIASTSCATAA